MFARAMKAVSLVSPAYYADLACELHKLLQGITSGEASSVSGNDEAVLREERYGIMASVGPS